MKKILLSLGAAFLLAAGAQAQVSYGIKAGLNLPKMTVSSGNASVSTSTSTNFYLTGYADLPVAPSFSIQPGLSLQGKGGKSKITDNIESKTDLMYLEVPVNAVYYIPAGAGNVFLGAGPYVGYGISGKTKTGDVKTDVEWGDDGIKRFDFGINTMLGYKLSNGFLINAGYGFGLTDISGASNGSVKNNVLSFGVGFQF
ncbi:MULTISPECIES: porin family protein [unclassified Sphingobacterium]|uniref:porin family protein n=1 Tax=unclassified Sphingobacterium TaxID=2609468 RepID=UPI0025EDE91C|nr:MULTISPECIES: porin family protein [unclassified Sphingobacterium]